MVSLFRSKTPRRTGLAALLAAGLAAPPAGAAPPAQPPAQPTAQQPASPPASQPGLLSGLRSGDRYLSLVLASAHFGTASHLRSLTPGLTYGRTWAIPNSRFDWFAEAGVFRNSYAEVSPVALAGVRYDLGRVGPAEIYFGGGAGLAYYRQLAPVLRKQYGIPNLGGFIPVAMLSLTAQVGRLEYRLTTVPAGRDSRAIFNLSVAIHY